jgi:hypothetical protein
VVWFTVQLDDKPGALARMAAALGDKGINITAIVGIAEDTEGALMLATSDAAGTRVAFDGLKLAFEEHVAAGCLRICDGFAGLFDVLFKRKMTSIENDRIESRVYRFFHLVYRMRVIPVEKKFNAVLSCSCDKRDRFPHA